MRKWFYLIVLVFHVVIPRIGFSADFPWSIFLPAILPQPTLPPDVSCSKKRLDLCVSKADCLKFNGYWYEGANICSGFTTSNHMLVGSWVDSWDETYLFYYPDGTFYGEEFGFPFSGKWVPTAANTVLRYDEEYNFPPRTIILLNYSTYIYKGSPSLGEYHRIN